MTKNIKSTIKERNEERWNRLEEGKEINFTVEEGKNGANLLVDYTIKT